VDTFLMICSVAADFGPYRGELYRVRPQDIGIMLQAPAWIKDTMMYKWLLADGAIKVADTAEKQKELENDPLKGLGADGKAQEEPAEEQPAKPARKTRAKKGEEA